MKNDDWLVAICLGLLAFIIVLTINLLRNDIKRHHQYLLDENLKLKMLIEDIKEKNNNTCVEKYYEIENTLNKIKVKLKI